MSEPEPMMHATTQRHSSIEQRFDLLLDIGWQVYTAFTAATIRDLGKEENAELTETMIRTHQSHYFLEGVQKLGLSSEQSDAVRCAKYHCLSNIVGGLPMGYAEESPHKAWVFYLTPTPIFNFGAGIAVMTPDSWVRVAQSWHARNGEALGNPALQAVVSHSVARGDPYDAVYFEDTGRRLPPEEKLRISWGEEHPSIQRVELDSGAWPPERKMRGLRNYLLGYIAAYLRHLIDRYSAEEAARITEYAYRIVLFQRLDVLRSAFQVSDDGPQASAEIFAGFQLLFGDDPVIEEGTSGEEVIVRQETSRLHRFIALQGDGMVEMPRQVEDAIARAWAGFANYLEPGISVTQTASLADGDGCLEWTVRRDQGRAST